MPRRYNLRNIRTLFTEGFKDEELRAFCLDEPNFNPVFDQLAQDTGKTKMVSLILEHANQHLLFDALLALAKEHNPARYERHQPYYKSVEFIRPKRQLSPRDFRRWLQGK